MRGGDYRGQQRSARLGWIVKVLASVGGHQQVSGVVVRVGRWFGPNDSCSLNVTEK